MALREKACKQCGTIGPPIMHAPGDTATQIILLLLLFVPGIIYTVWRDANRKPVCRACKSPDLVPVNTPEGRRIRSLNPADSAVQSGVDAPERELADSALESAVDAPQPELQIQEATPRRNVRSWLSFSALLIVAFVTIIVLRNSDQSLKNEPASLSDMQYFAKTCRDAFVSARIDAKCDSQDQRHILTVVGRAVNRALAVKFMTEQREVVKAAGFRNVIFWNEKKIPDVFTEDFPIEGGK